MFMAFLFLNLTPFLIQMFKWDFSPLYTRVLNILFLFSIFLLAFIEYIQIKILTWGEYFDGE